MEVSIFHGTTIVSARRGNQVALGGDGQVTLGHIVIKASARKVRRLYHDRVVAGFAGAGADAITLFERFEQKLEKVGGNLRRAAVELAKDWRTDRYLRRLEAMMLVADKDVGIVQTNDLPNTLASLKIGAIQAGVVVAPVTLQARKLGFTELVDMTKIGGPFPFNGVVAMRDNRRHALIAAGA